MPVMLSDLIFNFKKKSTNARAKRALSIARLAGVVVDYFFFKKK